jgi:hypothetical protein
VTIADFISDSSRPFAKTRSDYIFANREDEQQRLEQQAALLHDLEQFWIDNNLATNGENHTVISNEYLMAHAVSRTTRS